MSSCNGVNASVSSGFIIKGIDGKDGFSPKITVAEDSDTSYRLNITDINGSFITPNLKGKDGIGSGGSENDGDYSIKVNLDTTNYILTISLVNGEGLTVSSQSVDFPIESVVVNGSYNSATKSLTLTLQNGNTINIPIADIVNGLATISYVDTLISGITQIVNNSNKDISSLSNRVDNVELRAQSVESLANSANQLASTAENNAQSAIQQAQSAQSLAQQAYDLAQSGSSTGGAVSSVNGKTGAVVLTAEDVGAADKSEFETIRDIVYDLTYSPPTTTLSLVGNTSTVDMTSDSLTRQVTGFTHRETNKQNIQGSLKFSYGSNTVDVEAKDTSTTITLSSPISINFSSNGTRTATFTISGTSVKNTAFSASASITSYYPAFFGVSIQTPTDLSSFTKTSNASINGTRQVTISGEPQYVWFCTTGAISSIKSNGFDVPFEKNSTLSYKGTTYNLYRTSSLVVAGTHSFVVA